MEKGRSNKSWLDRFDTFKKEKKHSEMIKGIYKIEKSISLKGFKYKVVNLHTQSYSLYRKSCKITSTKNGFIVKNTRNRDITYYSIKHHKLIIIDNDYKVL